jgi:hypothetical protein
MYKTTTGLNAFFDAENALKASVSLGTKRLTAGKILTCERFTKQRSCSLFRSD